MPMPSPNPIISAFLKSILVMVLPFWYWLTVSKENGTVTSASRDENGQMDVWH